MSNPVIDIIRTAHANKWCTTPYCTTCGAMEYRQALKKIGGDLGGGLANALAELNPSELTKEHSWQDALLVAVIDLPFSIQLEGVLKAWLPKLHDDMDFSDFVLYKIVRFISKENDIRNEWIDNCIETAGNHYHFSMIESLLLVLKKKIIEYPVIVKIATEFAMSSRQMRRVLQNACGIKLQ
jgi:hypothetical protein